MHTNGASSAFLAQHPAYEAAAALDDIRRDEYPQLAAEHLTYLDYTGAGLASVRQLQEHFAWLTGEVHGNPHSPNRPSLKSTDALARARENVLAFFHADPEEYVVVFTQNATGALHLLGESFPFTADAQLLMTSDNHNSVLGLREFARRGHTPVAYLPMTKGDLRADEATWHHLLATPSTGGARLFAYPAQSNFSGVRHDLEWVNAAQERGWRVLLDAAAWVPTMPLNLSTVHPDFVPLSFYKMFGYPTGVGCLIARREAVDQLSRPWFSGGTVLASSLAADKAAMLPAPAGFEDGTPDFLNIPAVSIGLRHLERLGLDRIHDRTTALLAWILADLHTLRHANGHPVIQVLGPREPEAHGPTVAFRVLAPDGLAQDERLVIEEANAAGIVLRSGCFCNPGAGEAALGFAADRLNQAFQHAGAWHSIDELVEWMEIPTLGVVRLSMGAVSNFADVETAAAFLRTFTDRPVVHRAFQSRAGC
jgi:selenocysteine lyase/cysteine desulfurase